ncbi:MAG TPA: hypothetical protein VN836_09630 [Verrucomicrobiae bacterium]|nr:hypothetical protein [Verrucomicrobiae bacterium]
MANQLKPILLAELKKRYGSLRKLDATQSLYEIGEGAARVYIRYSKLHGRNQGFYGLRKDDLQKLEGLPSVISAILWLTATNVQINQRMSERNFCWTNPELPELSIFCCLNFSAILGK